LLYSTFSNLHPTYFLISKNILYSENKNPELKNIHFRKTNPEYVILFWKLKFKISFQKINFGMKKYIFKKRGLECTFICISFNLMIFLLFHLKIGINSNLIRCRK